jgi:predicted RNase H-like HicB family nuclease
MQRSQGEESTMIAVTMANSLRGGEDSGALSPPAHRNSLRQVMLIRGEGGSWVAECPSLPGCFGHGKTRELAIESIKESIAGHLCELEAWDLPVPEERFDALIVAV